MADLFGRGARWGAKGHRKFRSISFITFIGASLLLALRLLIIKPRDDASILVLYALADNDQHAIPNFAFFLKSAISRDTRSRYIIILQGFSQESRSKLPSLPSHAEYVLHSNQCYDWGTYGWMLQSGMVNWRKFKFFLFINSSVRGPFLESYFRGHWTDPFLSLLRGRVKLVGPTISCEGSPFQGNVQGHWRKNPHVQSYAFATDIIGLDVLLQDPNVFTCHSDRWDAIYYSELGSSEAMFKAGYSIDCFLLRYANMRWENTTPCLDDKNPLFNYELPVDPLEVMFVKFKHDIQPAMVAKYSEWVNKRLDN
jgi:hypothetical protein